VALLAPGNYGYHVTGSSTSALGSQHYDENSTLQVDRPQGHRQHTKQQDKSGSTEQELVAATDGLRLGDLHLSQQGFNEDFRPSSPVLLLPANPSAGQRWQWSMRSTDGKYTLHGRLEVTSLHSSAQTTDGSSRKTITISSVLDLRGKDIDMTIHQQDQATRDGVIVREHTVTDGTAYGTKFSSDLTRTLSSQP
jgi:hypothetical protein